jgi:hypothetical protein
MGQKLGQWPKKKQTCSENEGKFRENIWTHKRIRLDHTNKQGDNGHITTERYYKLYKILLR